MTSTYPYINITEENIPKILSKTFKVFHTEYTPHHGHQLFITCDCGQNLGVTYKIHRNRKCLGCGEYILNTVREELKKEHTEKIKARREEKAQKIVGTILGGYKVLGVIGAKVEVECVNGTKKVIRKPSPNAPDRKCRCLKCQPDRGYTHRKYHSVWRSIKDQEKSWGNYYNFEKWLDENLPKPRDKTTLVRINKDLPWAPANIFWGSSSVEIHISVWKTRVLCTPEVELLERVTLGLSSCFLFRCTKGHKFHRQQSSVMLSMSTSNPVSCMVCLDEERARKAALRPPITPRSPTYINDLIHGQHPTVTLVGKYKSIREEGVFECSKCNTSFKLPISVMRTRLVCPICKSKGWANKCDLRIEKDFNGRILRTGTWKNSETRTSWKCTKHHTHFVRTYGDIISMVSGGCHKCIDSSVDPTAPTRVYYVKIAYEDTYLYKIGITQRKGLKRFDKEISKGKLTLIKDWTFPTWQEAWDEEHRILDVYSEHLLRKGERPLYKSGNTEIFYTDVLGLDK